METQKTDPFFSAEASNRQDIDLLINGLQQSSELKIVDSEQDNSTLVGAAANLLGKCTWEFVEVGDGTGTSYRIGIPDNQSDIRLIITQKPVPNEDPRAQDKIGVVKMEIFKGLMPAEIVSAWAKDKFRKRSQK